MSWRDRLREGSYNGAGFKTDGHVYEFGRELVVHQYPGMETPPDSEDMGPLPDEFSLQVYVIGDNYDVDREALIAALKKPGEGTLVHPYRGEVQVKVSGKVRMYEDKTKGGKARFEIPFIRTGAAQQPTITVDTAAASIAASSAAADSADQQLQDNYTPPNADQLTGAIKAVTQALSDVESYIDQAQDIASEITQLATLPDRLAARIRADIARIESIADLSQLFNVSYGGAGGADMAVVANNTALSYDVQTQALLAGVAIAAATVYVSYDDAIADRDQLLDQFDQMMLFAGDDLYTALQAARTALVSDITARAADLSRLTSYTPGETLPSLVIAQRLYGADQVLDRADDIVARNHILHPGFVPGGRPLEVLSA